MSDWNGGYEEVRSGGWCWNRVREDRYERTDDIAV